VHASGVDSSQVLLAAAEPADRGSNECSWNLLHAACVLHYPVNFLSADRAETFFDCLRRSADLDSGGTARAESGSRHSHVIIIGGEIFKYCFEIEILHSIVWLSSML